MRNTSLPSLLLDTSRSFVQATKPGASDPSDPRSGQRLRRPEVMRCRHHATGIRLACVAGSRVRAASEFGIDVRSWFTVLMVLGV